MSSSVRAGPTLRLRRGAGGQNYYHLYCIDPSGRHSDCGAIDAAGTGADLYDSRVGYVFGS